MDIDNLPAHYRTVPLSLPLRMEAKRKRTRAGIAGLVIGVPITGLGIFGFMRGGAEILGLWGVIFGPLAIFVGVFYLIKASKSTL